MPVPPASGTYAGNTVAANYNPTSIDPYTGQAFGPPPAGVLRALHQQLLSDNGAPLDTFAPRFGFAWQPSAGRDLLSCAAAMAGSIRRRLQRQRRRDSAVHRRPFAQGFTNADSSNGSSTFQTALSAITLGFVPRTPTSQLSDRVAGPDYRSSQAPAMESQRAVPPRRARLAGRGLCRLARQPPADLARIESAAACQRRPPVNCGYDGNAARLHHHEHGGQRAARVPVLGETPTALARYRLRWRVRPINSLQTTLRQQVAHGLTLQATYTFSRAANNTSIYNDLNDLSPRLGARQLRPHAPLHHKLRVPDPVAAPHEWLWRVGSVRLVADRHRHRADRPADDSDRSQRRRRLRARGHRHRLALSRRDLRQSRHRGQHRMRG